MEPPKGGLNRLFRFGSRHPGILPIQIEDAFPALFDPIVISLIGKRFGLVERQTTFFKIIIESIAVPLRLWKVPIVENVMPEDEVG